MKQIAPIKRNLFISWVLKYQVITFTIVFLLFYRLLTTLIIYFNDKEYFLKQYKFSIEFFIILIIIIYFFQWVIASYTVSRFTNQSLKDKFNSHPIVTIILSLLYLAGLPYRLSEYDLGRGIFKLINAFEIIVYYGFVLFLWWLLICWTSSKVRKKQLYQWNWYKKTIDKLFAIVPYVYKFILALIIALFIFIIIFVLISKTINYSGSDLIKLLH